MVSYFVVHLVWSLYELDGMLFPFCLISAQRIWYFLVRFIVSIDSIMVIDSSLHVNFVYMIAL